MSQDALLKLMTAAVVLSGIAMAVQAAMLVGMFRALKGIRQQMEAFRPRAESLIESAERTLEQSRRQFGEIAGKAEVILDSTRTQMDRLDEVVREASARARVQMDRLEIVFDDTVSRVHQTITLLNDGVLRPLREMNGIATGFRAAFAYLLRGGRPTVAQATSDEEMFI